MNFAHTLLTWAAQNTRLMPWKGETDPYKIWLSEIILQQTRVEQGLPYYERFVAAYPTVSDLANASPDEVMRLWQGLGYYSRARNLHATAQTIRDSFSGHFPTNYTDIRALKGIGDYTAAAIASFAYNLPFAVVDGNVYRVLARIFGIFTPIDSTQGKKEFAVLAQNLLESMETAAQSARYNQAIIDFGATHCTPKSPNCTTCPFLKNCKARVVDLIKNENSIGVLPVKSKKNALKHRYFHYFYFGKNNGIWIQKRTEKDIWQDLWQLPLLETSRSLSSFKTFLPKKQAKNQTQIVLFQEEKKPQKFKKIVNSTVLKLKNSYFKIRNNDNFYKKNNLQQVNKWNSALRLYFGESPICFNHIIETEQTLSHQKIHCRFYRLKNEINIDLLENNHFSFVEKTDLQNFAFPKSIVDFLKNNL